jgi:PmbA protein
MEFEKAVSDAVKRLEGEDVDSFEVAGLASNALTIEAKRQKVDSFNKTVSRGLAIRVIRKGSAGFSSTTDISAKAVAKAVSQSLDALKITSPSEDAVVAKPESGISGFAEKVGRSFAEIPDDEKMALALKLESETIAADSRIARVRSPRYEEIVWQQTIVNSEGVRVSSKRGLVLCEVSAIAVDGNLTESAYDFCFSPRFEDLDVRAVARSAAARAVGKLGASPLEGGEMPVVFENRAAASMLGLLAPSFFADNVQKGKSTIANKKGEKIYSDLVTIVDDGILAGGYSSFPFDGEGVPSEKTTMVNRGRQASWLYDTARAMKDGTLSTGNCRRNSINKLPVIGVTNCYLENGASKRNDLIRGISNGFMVTSLMGLHTANAVTGDFSLGAEGFVVSNGLVSRPVRGVTIAGNIHDLFAAVEAVADDFHLGGTFGSPSILVKSLMLGG